MRATLTVATLPAGPMLTQYGVRAPITLDSESLSYPGNYGRPHGWTDAHIPRTEKPVRFAPAKFAYWYARWHMRPVYCRQSPLPRIGESVIYRDA